MAQATIRRTTASLLGLGLRTIRPKNEVQLLRRGYHTELGLREKALLGEDPALEKFKSYKNTVKQVSKVGDTLTFLTVAACSYEIFAVASRKKM